MNHHQLLELAAKGELTEDIILKITQETRRNMLVGMIADGVPTDSKNGYRLMKLLEDMDASALAVKKIGSDEDSADADRKAAVFIASMQRNLGGVNPLQRQGEGSLPVVDLNELPQVELKPGEADIGVSELTYKEFTKED